MKKRSVSRGVPAILLTLLLVFGILPAKPSQAAETIDMRVGYQLDGVSSVSKGMPFGAYFFFYLPGSYSSPPTDAKVSVSASGVALSKKSFPLQDYASYPGDLVGDGAGTAPSYFIYIPEQYMTNAGRSPAILKFTITWTEGSESYRAYAQKTITECVYEAGSEPEDPEEKKYSLLLENYSVNSQNVREGDRFTFSVTVKNNGEAACENVYVSLPSLDQITVDGKLNAQSTPTLAAGATATFHFPMVCAPSMTTGNVPIAVAVSSDEVQEKTTNAYVYVTGTAGNPDSSEPSGETPEMKPIVILESYDRLRRAGRPRRQGI